MVLVNFPTYLGDELFGKMLGFIFHTWSIWVRLCIYPMSNPLLSQNGIEDSANRSWLNPPWVPQRNVRRMRRKPKFMTSGVTQLISMAVMYPISG